MKLWPIALASLGLLAAACNDPALKPPAADAGPAAGGLTPDQAARTVAKVGDRTITLGDYAKTLERMDQYDRLRYQSKERRRELLEEMVDVELLAAEARRLGLDKEPEAQDAVRTILRDAILAQAREGLPTPAQITDQEIRAYYDAHLDKFTEPERRRVAAIVMADKKEAQKVLEAAKKAKTPAEWGDLFFKHSSTAPKQRGPLNPAELAGDLGIVGPLSDPRGANEKVPEPVRARAFELKAVGEIAAELVEFEGRQYVVRLNGITAGHKRSLAEADRAIRVVLIQEKMQERERALEDELKKKFPVEIDDKALESVKVPAGVQQPEAAPQPNGAGAQAAPDGKH
jgi:hypothetical protein